MLDSEYSSTNNEKENFEKNINNKKIADKFNIWTQWNNNNVSFQTSDRKNYGNEKKNLGLDLNLNLKFHPKVKIHRMILIMISIN